MKTTDAVDALKVYLAKEGLKFTHQRKVVTEVFFDPNFRHQHPNVEELYLRIRKRDPKIGYATVYRTLKLLVNCGLAEPSRFGDNQTRYEPDIPGEHHDHLVCTDCGVLIEFEDEQIERLQEKVAKRFGFVLSDHKMVLFGQPSEVCEVVNCQRPTS
ncbi:MAG: transcriptional repressor [Myxococcota bacterium]|nr:transcriptional repressor [Myxococcota bacterium]